MIERHRAHLASLVPDLEKAVSDLSEKTAAWKRLAGEAESQIEKLKSRGIAGADMFRPEDRLTVVAGVTPDVPDDSISDLAMVLRVTAAYGRGAEEQLRHKEGMWADFFETHNRQIHDALVEADTAKVTDILRNPAASMLFCGFDPLNSEFAKRAADPEERHHYVTRCLDGLARFADAVGALRLYNAESKNSDDPRDADSLLGAIDNVLEKPVAFPAPFPNEIGARSPRGIISFCVPQALYQAWRIRQLTREIENPRILEIGGGLGRTAYYARQFGINDYTIIDIPFTGVSQGYFLMRTLGEHAVILHGEEAEDTSGCIKLLPPSAFHAGSETYDLIVNCDSLTELPAVLARRYMRRIEESTSTFLSINHEYNTHTVREYIGESIKVASFERMPYWMRKGYAEELVHFEK